MKTICTSGYFNPLHKGHLALFKAARQYGDKLVVIVNNDEQVRLKGSVPFMSEMERLEIVQAISGVDLAILAIDKDRTVQKTLSFLNPDFFVKGGDSTEENTPELTLCRKKGIGVLFDIGGEKIQSSSWLKRIKN